jgi:hypothetical protein
LGTTALLLARSCPLFEVNPIAAGRAEASPGEWLSLRPRNTVDSIQPSKYLTSVLSSRTAQADSLSSEEGDVSPSEGAFMQLKHVPLCFLILGSICLAGAVTASDNAPAKIVTPAVVKSSNGL